MMSGGSWGKTTVVIRKWRDLKSWRRNDPRRLMVMTEVDIIPEMRSGFESQVQRSPVLLLLHLTEE